MATPHRALVVTSPNIRGGDVEAAQRDLNWWAKRFELDPTGADGEWGPDSRRLARQVLFLLGALKPRYMDAFTVHEQKIVSHRTSPELPPELSRSARRRSAHRRKQRRAKLKREAAANKGLGAVERTARKYLGVKESPPGSNSGGKINLFLKAAQMGPGPWCGAFVIYILRLCGFVVPYTWRYVPTIITDARAGRYGRIVSASQRQGGDLVCFDWDGNGVFDHVGFVTAPPPGETVEGNTSAGWSGSQSDGGGVFERTDHASGAKRVIYVRPTKRS